MFERLNIRMFEASRLKKTGNRPTTGTIETKETILCAFVFSLASWRSVETIITIKPCSTPTILNHFLIYMSSADNARYSILYTASSLNTFLPSSKKSELSENTSFTMFSKVNAFASASNSTYFATPPVKR